MNKKIIKFVIATVFIISFASCERDDNTIIEKTEPTQGGIIIGGIEWATRNVATPGIFAQNPEDFGMFFQWNRQKGWTATGENTAWNSSTPSGSSWARANDPCPNGWRVPTRAELQRLAQTDSEWTSKNGVEGRLFGTTPNQIFLPAAGLLNNYTGEHQLLNLRGQYWSSSRYNRRLAHGFRIFPTSAGIGQCHRAAGLSVRCVAIE